MLLSLISRLWKGNLFCLCTPSSACVLQTVAPTWQTVGYSPVTKHLLPNSWQSLPKINVRGKHKFKWPWKQKTITSLRCSVITFMRLWLQIYSIWGHLRIKLIKPHIRKGFVLEPHLLLQKAVANVNWIEDCGIWKLVSHVPQVLFKLGRQCRCDVR